MKNLDYPISAPSANKFEYISPTNPQHIIQNFDGGIVITASHNPSEYNGLKFLQTDGTFLSPEQCEKLFKAVDQNVSIDPPDSLGVVSDYSTANEEHIDCLLYTSPSPRD